MPALLPLRRPSASLALLLTAALLFALAGCDTGGPTAGPSEAPGTLSSAKSTSGTDSLRLVPAWPGASLLPLPPAGGPESRTSSRIPRGASPYGCLVSTLRAPKQVAAGKERYRYDGYFLHFPSDLLERASGTQHATFVLGSRTAPDYAQAAEAAGVDEGPGADGGVMRLAQCRLPAGSGEVNAEAQAMMRERLQQVSGPDRWIAERTAGEEEEPNGWECTEWVTTFICLPNFDSCSKKERTCVNWEYVQHDDPLGGDDGGGGLSGGGPSDGCEENPDGTFSDVCFDGGGGGIGGGDDYNPLQPTEDDTGIAADTLRQFMLPDCSNPSQLTISWQIKYCRSSLPNATQENRIADALNRIAQRGQACQRIAQRGFLYLNNDLIHHFPTGQYFYGFGDTGIVMIWQDWIDTYYNGANARSGTVPGTNKTMEQNLDSILVHEFDHIVFNTGHIDPNDLVTPHEKQCSGLSYPYP